MSDNELEQVFQQGVAAIRAGDKARARELLTKVVEADQLHEQAWLWLSAAVTSKDEQILCLENVLTINPDNEIAQRGLRKLGARPAEPAPAPVAAAPAPPPPQPEPKPKPANDETWRDRLKDQDYVSEATIVKPMHEHPRMGISDLANAWMWAAIFQIPGPYQDEVDYGPAGHILVSAVVAVLIEILGIGAYLVINLTNPRNLAAFRQGMTSQLPRGSSVSSAIPVTVTATTLVTILAVAFVVLVIGTVVWLLFQAIVTNRVAEWLGGKGAVIPLTQALTIALVPSQLILLPGLILSALTPGVGIGAVLVGAAYLYQFAQTANAVNASHRLGILASMGAVVISGFAMGLIGCCLAFVAQLVFGVGLR